jgi:hypothetical protein
VISLAWSAYDDADCDSFNVYRSVPGFVVSFPNSLVIGDQLVFSATSSTVQTVTFSAVDINSVVSQFNATAKGIKAYKNNAGTAVIFRLQARTGAKLKLYDCTFLTHISLAPQIIVPQLLWALVGNVPRVDTVFDYTYDDIDGTDLDAYRITSVVGSTESLPSLIQTPMLGTDILCAIEGRVADSQNRPVQGLIVRAQVRVPMTSTDQHALDWHTTEVKTDAYGRFTMYLPRNCVYLLQIPNVGYNEEITVPDKATAGFLDIIPTSAGDFSPYGDPQ